MNRDPAQSKKSVPTWLIVIGVIFGLAFLIGAWGNSPAGQRAKEEARAREAQEASQTKPTKNAGEKAFGSQLIGYTESDDGRILVAYIMSKAELRSIHTEIKRFMQTLMSEKREKPWVDVTISAHGYIRDQYGKETTQPAYTITIPYEEATKVESWPFADLEAIGRVTLRNATLR